MLLSKRCPYTSVVNFFDDAEPHIAIASITKCGTAASGHGFTWRSYATEHPLSGHTPDASTAESKLRVVLHAAQRSKGADLKAVGAR
jgi:hypothetical protein